MTDRTSDPGSCYASDSLWNRIQWRKWGTSNTAKLHAGYSLYANRQLELKTRHWAFLCNGVDARIEEDRKWYETMGDWGEYSYQQRWQNSIDTRTHGKLDSLVSPHPLCHSEEFPIIIQFLFIGHWLSWQCLIHFCYPVLHSRNATLPLPVLIDMKIWR